MDVKGAKALKQRIAITRFSGEYDFLSNFYPSPVTVDGREYRTLEHAFQAAKTGSLGHKIQIAAQPTPGKAKRAGRIVKLRPDWEEIKIETMHDLLRKKFAPGSELAKKLLDTGDRDLVEGNDHKDDFWGMVKVKGEWEGENHLGKLLMRVREELRENA